MDLDHIELTEKEKVHVTLQVDHFIEILAKRYKLEPNDIVETVRWVNKQRNLSDKLQAGAMISLLGVIAGALLMSIWEGVKHYIAKGHD